MNKINNKLKINKMNKKLKINKMNKNNIKKLKYYF